MMNVHSFDTLYKNKSYSFVTFLNANRITEAKHNQDFCDKEITCTIHVKVPYIPNNLQTYFPKCIIENAIKSAITYGTCTTDTIRMLQKMSKSLHQNKHQQQELLFKNLVENVTNDDITKNIEMRVNGILNRTMKNICIWIGSNVGIACFCLLHISSQISPYIMYGIGCICMGYIFIVDSETILYTDSNNMEDMCDNIFTIAARYTKLNDITEDGFYTICIAPKASKNGHCIGCVVINSETYIYDCNSGLYKGSVSEIVEQLSNTYFNFTSTDCTIAISKIIFN